MRNTKNARRQNSKNLINPSCKADGGIHQFEAWLENLAKDLELAAQKFEAADNG